MQRKEAAFPQGICDLETAFPRLNQTQKTHPQEPITDE